MIDLLQNFLSFWVVFYILTIIAIPLIAPIYTQYRQRKRHRKRLQAGLDTTTISNPGDGLRHQRSTAIIESLISLAIIIIVPLILITLLNYNCLPFADDKDDEIKKINVAFVALLIWTLVSGTSIAKNFLGGLAFRSLTAFSHPIQVGDRVTLLGHHGIIKHIGIFYTHLKTLDHDLISIPSATLLNEVLSSTNAGQRASLCKIQFFLDPTNLTEKIQTAEDIIWTSIQSSLYYDFAHPLKIFLTQEPHTLILTAKCYVTSTYEEHEFKSHVTKQALKSFAEKNILLSKLQPSTQIT